MARKRGGTAAVPYMYASSGNAARQEIISMLRKFGCEGIGFYDDFSAKLVLLQFSHRGRQVQMKASAAGWAKLYLRAVPWAVNRRAGRVDYENRAVSQGLVAVNSILRDWIKGQVTAIECEMLSFEEAFLPQMLTQDGRRLIEVVRGQVLLPAPKGE
jgi:hypothetical protein